MDDTSYSTGGFNDRDVESALDAIANAGFPQAEIKGGGVTRLGALYRLGDGRFPGTTRGPRGQGQDHARTWRARRARHSRRRPASRGRRASGALPGVRRRAGHHRLGYSPISNPDKVPDGHNPAVRGLIRDAVKRSLDDLVPAAAGLASDSIWRTFRTATTTRIGG